MVGKCPGRGLDTLRAEMRLPPFLRLSPALCSSLSPLSCLFPPSPLYSLRGAGPSV